MTPKPTRPRPTSARLVGSGTTDASVTSKFHVVVSVFPDSTARVRKTLSTAPSKLSIQFGWSESAPVPIPIDRPITVNPLFSTAHPERLLGSLRKPLVTLPVRFPVAKRLLEILEKKLRDSVVWISTGASPRR